jgi:hypothetical protein
MNAARIVIVSVALAVAALGCSSRTVVKAGGQKSSPPVVVVKDSKGGPPPHAPAHGYRHKHAKDNVVLVYDTGISVYIVSGYKDCYFNDGFYFRYSKSSWEMSAQIGGPWKIAVVDKDVPSGLKVKYAGKKSKSDKSKKAK